MKQIYFIGIALALLSPAVASAKIAPVELTPPSLFAEEDLSLDDLLAIIERIKLKIQAEPENYENYDVLALVYDRVGDYANELETLKTEVLYLPADLESKEIIYGNLARAYMLNDHWEEGKAWIDKADAINPRNFYNRWNAFEYYLRHARKFKEAAAQLKQLQEFYMDDRDQYFEAYMKALASEVPSDEIIELFREAVQLEPENNKTRRVLGLAIRDSSVEDYEANMPAALEELQKAVELDPRYIPTYISLGNTYMLPLERTKKDEENAKALEWFQKAYAIDPEDSRLAYSMGFFYYYQNDYDKAIEKLEYAFSQGLDDNLLTKILALAYNNKAYALYQTGKNLEEGLLLINKAITLFPENGIILGTKAELLYKAGKYEEAHKYIKQAIELEPGHAEMEQDLKMIEEALNPQ